MTTTAYPNPATHATTADPWDAPYFGGAVYFQYRASMTLTTQVLAPAATAKVAEAIPPTSQPQRVFATDPWDAPYFGGPIYLRFPAFAGPTTRDISERAEAALDQSTAEIASPEISQSVAVASPSEPATTSLDAPVAEPEVTGARATQRGRWGWLASLFGRG